MRVEAMETDKGELSISLGSTNTSNNISIRGITGRVFPKNISPSYLILSYVKKEWNGARAYRFLFDHSIT